MVMMMVIIMMMMIMMMMLIDDGDDEMFPPLFGIFKFPVVSNLQFQLFSSPPLSLVREYKEGNKRNGFHKNVSFRGKKSIRFLKA